MRSTTRLGKAAFAAMLLALGFPMAVGSQPTPEEQKELSRDPAILAAKPLEAGPKDDESQKLLKALYNERVAITQRHYQLFRQGSWPQCDTVFEPARRLKTVGMELFQMPAEKKILLERMLELSERVTSVVWIRKAYYMERGHPNTFDLQLHKIREFQLEIELDLLKLKKMAGAPPRPKVKADAALLSATNATAFFSAEARQAASQCPDWAGDSKPFSRLLSPIP